METLIAIVKSVANGGEFVGQRSFEYWKVSPGKDITSAMKFKNLCDVRKVGGSYGNTAMMTDRNGEAKWDRKPYSMGRPCEIEQ